MGAASPLYTSLSQEQIRRGTQEETGPHLLAPNQVISHPTCWSVVTFRQQHHHTSEAFDAKLAVITRGVKLIAERGGFVVIVISIYLYRERGKGVSYELSETEHRCTGSTLVNG